ncbi:MAG: hypothetical protein CL920_02055 [Deltaproteobacteria bacterium]|nr:hypothetical protein [Deltaproteobacteria bacterium]
MKHFIGAFFLVICLLPLGIPTASAKGQPKPKPLAFAIEGGVSLGSYEAGLVWAYVSIIKLRYERYVCEHDRTLPSTAKPYCKKLIAHISKLEKQYKRTLRSMLPVPYRLGAVSGASAGNANSLLASLHWYRQGIGGLHHNVMWDAWLSGGWSGLFPGKRSCAQYNKDIEASLELMVKRAGLSPKDVHIPCKEGKGVYLPDDGLLTRLGAHPTRVRIRKELQTLKLSPVMGHIFREGKQHFRVALPIARVKAKTIRSQGVVYNSQNAHVGFRIKVDGQTLKFVQDDMYFPAWDQRRVYLREDANGTVPFDRLYQVVEASAAFPVAFGAKQLSVCEEAGPNGLALCRKHKRYKNAYFFDGGTYENLPFGLAATMLEQRSNGARLLATNLFRDTFVWEKTPEYRPQRFEEFLGLQAILPFFTGFVTTARLYERDVFLREQRVLMRRNRAKKRRQMRRKRWTARRTLRQLKTTYRYTQLMVKHLTLQQKMLPKRRASKQARAKIDQKIKSFNRKLATLQAKIKAVEETLHELPKRRKLRKKRRKKRDNKRAVFLLPHKRETQVSHHLMGLHMYGFASFLGKHFRAFDYHIGVYDAMLQVACGKLRHMRDRIRPPREVVTEMKFLMALLGVNQERDSYARWVLRKALVQTIMRHKEQALMKTRMLPPLRKRFYALKQLSSWMFPGKGKKEVRWERQIRAVLQTFAKDFTSVLRTIREDARVDANRLLSEVGWKDNGVVTYTDINIHTDVLQSLAIVMMELRKAPSVVLHKQLDELLYNSSSWREAAVKARTDTVLRKRQTAFQAVWERVQKELQQKEHHQLSAGTFRRQYSKWEDLYSSALKVDGFLYALEDVQIQLKRRHRELEDLPLDSVEKKLLFSPQSWLRDTASVMLSRMWELEDIASNDNGKRIALLGMFVVDNDRQAHNVGLFEASSISHYEVKGWGALSRWLLPMRFGLTTYQESPSIELLWMESMLAWSSHHALTFSMLRFNLAGDALSLAPFGIYYRYRTQSILFGGFSVGVQFDFALIQPDISKGFLFFLGPTPEVALYFFGDKLRVGVGYQFLFDPLVTDGSSPWMAASIDPVRGLGVSVTVNDFKGILYWMVRFISAAR